MTKINETANEKELLTLSVTVKRNEGAEPAVHEVTLLAKDDEEIMERLKRWLVVTRKGRSIIAWEKKNMRRRQRAGN